MKEGEREREREREGAGVASARERACGAREERARRASGLVNRRRQAIYAYALLRVTNILSVYCPLSAPAYPFLCIPPPLSLSLALKSTVSLLTSVSRAVEFADALARKVVRARGELGDKLRRLTVLCGLDDISLLALIR